MTRVIYSLSEWKKCRKNIAGHIGLVTTMGNLHQGHLSLLERSKKENKITILTIFVNPTQFNDKSDYAHYPKTLDDDIKLANQCGVDYILAPKENEIYTDNYNFILTENNISKILEGKYRPGHFEGVLTVVLKFFNLIKPTRAYFGQKDYQQLILIKAMTEALFIDVDVIGCATIRHASFLALSSRNNRLTPDEFKKAEQFSQIFYDYSDENKIKHELKKKNIVIEYIEKWNNRLFAAVKVGGIRLIDNRELT